MADHYEFGKRAEDLAEDFLVRSGYRILVRNYRFLKAEIDIIAEADGLVIVVEVKARATDAFIEPHEAVNRKKIRKLVEAADHFMTENNRDENVRFDIISVLPDAGGSLRITHIPNAFEAIDF